MLRPYIKETQFTVRTDHNTPKWIPNLADVSSQLSRRRIRLSESDFDNVHRAGTKHQATDALYRLTVTKNDQVPVKDDLPVAVF